MSNDDEVPVMSSAVFCVLCAAGEHRPESHEVRATTLFTEPVGNDDLVMSVIQHYRITDNRLPYKERFKVERHIVEIAGGRDGVVKISAEIDESDALALARAFLDAAIVMRSKQS